MLANGGMTDAIRIGRYEILKHLASGGMGSVYLARSSGLAGFERHVVLKMLATVSSDDEEALAMFLDEARVIGRMHHQHIAQAHELDSDEDGQYFLVMDYVHGQTAKTVWQQTSELGLTLPLGFTLTVVIAAASALHYAHSLLGRDGRPLQIIHRDVSLSNLMLGYDGTVKLIDFGIAKAAERLTKTRSGHLKGTVSYIAPEQIAGEAFDHRADLFALGAVLYELATMTRAFRQSTDLETLAQIRRGYVVPPSRLVEDFPPDLERIILTALQSDPAARYQDADAMRRELEAFARRQGLAVGDSAIVTVMEVLFEDRDEPWLERGAGSHVVDAVPEVAEDVVTVPVTMELSSRDVVRLEEPPRKPAEVPMRRFERGRRTPIGVSDDGLCKATPSAVDDDPPFLDAATQPLGTPPRNYPRGTIPELDAPSPAPARSRSWSWVVIGVALMLCGAYVVLGAPTPRDPARAPAPAAKPPAVAAPVVTPILVDETPPPARSTVRIRITTTPADATIVLDGQWLGHTPFDGQVPASPGMHVFKIRRRGCVTRRLDLELSSDITRDVVLRSIGDE